MIDSSRSVGEKVFMSSSDTVALSSLLMRYRRSLPVGSSGMPPLVLKASIEASMASSPPSNSHMSRWNCLSASSISLALSALAYTDTPMGDFGSIVFPSGMAK